MRKAQGFNRWGAGLAFALALVLAGLLVGFLERERREGLRANLDSLAKDHARSLHSNIEQALTVSYALAALIRQGEGELDAFDTLAAEMLEFYPAVSVLALSPGGVIRQTAPFEENKAAIGFDQFADPVQGPEARRARDSGKMTLAGPLELVQGGLGVVGRLPVFLTPDDQEEFWGLVNVVLRMPVVLEASGLDVLPTLGIDYELWRLDPQGQRQVIASAGRAVLAAPVTQSIALPNGEWVLSLAPRGGWWNLPLLAGQLALALLFALLIGGLVQALLVLQAHQAQLEAQVRSRTAEIQQAQHQLEATLAAVPDLLFELDALGVYHSFHSPREELLVAPVEQLLGRSISEVLPKEVADAAFAALAEAETQGWSTGTQYALDLPQGRHWFELSVAKKTVPPGEIARYIVLVRDISARRQVDEALRDAESRYLQAQKMESVGRLAGGVAHDFNNLLTVIHGAVDIATERLPEGHPVLAELAQISAAAQRGAGLTQQLLSYSRQQVMRPQPLDLNQVVNELLAMIRRMLGEDIRIRSNLTHERALVLGDPAQLNQVLLNLAINARDAMPEGGVLSVDTHLVHLDADAVRHLAIPPGNYMLLRVADTGVGMAPEVQQRIFEPFFSTKEAGRGSGLGLATVYGIVRQSRGDIFCQSFPGEGTSFNIYLPVLSEIGQQVQDFVAVEATPAPGLTGDTGAEPGPAPGALSGARILVVEDEPAISLLVQRVLQSRGYQVLTAENAEQALAQVGRQSQPLDLLITDIVMPGMSGVDLAARLQAEYPGLLVLFTSGYADHAILRDGKLPPDASFLSKPYTMSRLLSWVERLLHQVALQQQAAQGAAGPEP